MTILPETNGAYLDVSNGLIPTHRHEGRYIFIRHAFDTETEVIEPDGSSYLLEVMNLELFLKRILKLREERISRLVDYLWNFRIIQYDTTTDHMSIIKSKRKIQSEVTL